MKVSEKKLSEQLREKAWDIVQKKSFWDIDRIADGGFENTPEDHLLVRKMACLIRGEISLRILNSVKEN